MRLFRGVVMFCDGRGHLSREDRRFIRWYGMVRLGVDGLGRRIRSLILSQW